MAVQVSGREESGRMEVTAWQFRLENISEDVTAGCIIRCLVSVAMTTRYANLRSI